MGLFFLICPEEWQKFHTESVIAAFCAAQVDDHTLRFVGDISGSFYIFRESVQRILIDPVDPHIKHTVGIDQTRRMEFGIIFFAVGSFQTGICCILLRFSRGIFSNR